ncbi:tetratricopeptide repeat domain-containing protein [Aspergillus heterothallicus]
MDPLSITAATMGLGQAALQLINYLASVKTASKNIQKDIDILEQEVTSLITNNSLPRSQPGQVLMQRKTGVEQLSELLEDVVGKQGSLVAGRLDGLRKSIRKQNRDDEFMRIRQRLILNQSFIQPLVLLICDAYTHKAENSQNLAFSKLSEHMQGQYTGLHCKIISISQKMKGLTNSDKLHQSLASVNAVVSRITFNEHFDIPQNVSGYYTGRQQELNELKSALKVAQSRERQEHQKRFVIYGAGGAGKTQFSCKFAQDNREYYWGVCWIDGSTYENAKHSFARIATIGGFEPNEAAGKHWLSSLNQPWLLLIDDADDPEIDVLRLCPKGERGVILITTRNPSNKRHGTEGSRFFHLDKLEAEEASDLVRAAAVCPRPWEIPTKQYAKRIAEVLGYLPLALIHAGKAILENWTSLSEYPEFYQRTWHRIRRFRGQNHGGEPREEPASHIAVYSSYEIIYVGLENKKDQRSKDALDLMRIFSFFYWEHIEYEMIKVAALNPRREREDARARERMTPKPINPRPKTWSEIIREWAAAAIVPLTRPTATLPAVLRDEDDTPFDEDRLRSALSLLVGLGMLTLLGENNTYGMHPLVHTWVRERPETSTGEQAVWCQAAATVLAQSVCFQAPSAYIYPHVEHMRRLQRDIQNRFKDAQRASQRPWPLSEYIHAKLGTYSEYYIRISLLLSTTHRLQTRNNKARQLQYQVLESSRRKYGPDHPMTLEIMDTLGATCLLCSRLREADDLHRIVIDKLSHLEGFGPEHEATLTAIHNLARVRLRSFDYEDAIMLLSQAYQGFKQKLGLLHQKTLEAQDNLAGMYGFKGETYLPEALRMSEEVRETRSKILGREHPLTLTSGLTLAKIKTAMNQFDEAEKLFLEGLPCAERNLGATRLGTLTGRSWYAHLLWRQGRYTEAKNIWEDVIRTRNFQESDRADGEHFDRVQSMWFLVHCYEDQGNIDDALKMCEDVAQLVQHFGGEGQGRHHKFWGYIQEKREELLRLLDHSQKNDATEHKVGNCLSIDHSAIPPKRVIKGFTF